MSVLLETEDVLDYSRGVDPELLAGIIGSGAAAEFNAYIKLHTHLPDIDAILDKGGTFTHEEDGVKFAYVMALVNKYVERPTEK
ncbi:hypothetical protein, partial [Klebsiella pneumoniae]|uniref:hypothetical protein n=1 Tax=Klebsiella pneumoniae TaxID=573 RepID=UPI0039E69A96